MGGAAQSRIDWNCGSRRQGLNECGASSDILRRAGKVGEAFSSRPSPPRWQELKGSTTAENTRDLETKSTEGEIKGTGMI